MIKGVANVWVPVEDVDRALDFYENTLGCSVVKRDGAWAEVKAGELNIGLNGREERGAGVEGGPVITFEPEGGIEETRRDLESRGVRFDADVSEHEWGKVATFKDSEGNDLQLYEPPSS
ncbi:Glyoxalase-like domain [Rubrobacter radiotolerans]|uniref:Glyoxalase-like domain n=1 Tax=Rubrobacter radiotolerans TaxID=42256 RepID=A0A023X4U2_RUBRA|nr:VOC family protein [Rubrobacter radiotolerans]AHY47373.1 Glyoxalase-like domain [Rubrobacter radiotolerans]MDX5894777.1 VOC family protein [Rubrobacter radiotolerans]SMC06745.1 Catechol 2,3-dioxygenase [Rubrobacter radiotolerans DSM 5868]